MQKLRHPPRLTLPGCITYYNLNCDSHNSWSIQGQVKQSVRRNYAKFTQFDIAQKEVIDRIGGSMPEEKAAERVAQ